MASLNLPTTMTLDIFGNLYITDTDNHRIRKIDVNGIITTVAGNGNEVYNGDDQAATLANVGYPSSIVFDKEGNFYICDQSNHRIRKVHANGIIYTVAGTGIAAIVGDYGLATETSLNYPVCMSLDSAGNLYVVEHYNYRVRKVDVNGVITTAAGTGSFGYNGDNIAATDAQLSFPTWVTTDASGNLYISDRYRNRIRKVTFPSPPTAMPTLRPTGNPSLTTTANPSFRPSAKPSKATKTKIPSFRPTEKPTQKKKTADPSRRPATAKPTKKPTK